MNRPVRGPNFYPPTVTLVRRVTRDAPDLTATSAAEIEAWLLGEATREDDTHALVEAFAWRLSAIGFGIERLSFHVGTLHPQAIGFAWNWTLESATTDEIRVAPEATDHDSFRRNPLYGVIRLGEDFRGRTDDPELVQRFPILGELRAQGFTDYAALSLGEMGDRHNAVTFATTRPGGFEPEGLAAIDRLLRIFALHLQRHIAVRIAQNVVRTYLGPEIGRRILEGQVRRYMGEVAEGVIWFSDLRGYTALSERLAPDAVLAVLNAYFEAMVEAIHAAGGEVLKFVGDGLLAGFGGPELGGSRGEARAALAAARRALEAVAAINASPHAELAGIDGWAPLRTGIALHRGQVFFGNVGAPDRLDFTVIGRAVNVASRVEGLCAALGRDILVTEALARELDEPVDDLGRHGLKGVSEPVQVYGPRTG